MKLQRLFYWMLHIPRFICVPVEELPIHLLFIQDFIWNNHQFFPEISDHCTKDNERVRSKN
jgi:hypothetical protein